VACCAVIRQAQKPGAFIIFGLYFLYGSFFGRI